MRDIRIAIYGDVNLNIIDGSAIWLQSIAATLSSLPRCELTVVLKASEQRDLLTRSLRDIPHVKVVNPIDEGRVKGSEISRNQALDVLEELDAQSRFDAFIMRGRVLCHNAATRKRPTFRGRLWPYLTDIPQHRDALNEQSLGELRAIASGARYVLCQTEPLRSFLESHVHEFAGKAILLPPMIPDKVDSQAVVQVPLADDEPLRLVYVGKYARLWNTHEMIQAVAKLRSDGVLVELHMVGDKIHEEPRDPGFFDRMQAALNNTDGVIWHKAKSREETLAMLPKFHVAIGWRNSELDDSRELSTKLLEYGAAGLPTIVNRNPMHEELLGVEYPLFANSLSRFMSAVIDARDSAVRKFAGARVAERAEKFQFRQVARSLEPWLDRAVPRRDLRSRGQALRVLVVSHDLKFFTRIQDHLGAIRGVELRVDAWSTISEHDKNHSEELLQWAEVIICEWCTNGAIWYSKRKRPGQRLIVRLHRFELYGRYPSRLNFDNVDTMVFVGDYYRDEAIARLGWAPERLTVVPNWVDTESLDRSKVPGAFFRLGMIGIAPMRKRLDRGIRVLELLRRVDERFQLYIKTKQVWDYPWIWAKSAEQDHYRDVFRHINSTPSLRGAVHFDSFGPDVGAWLRKIGFVLSTSDDESFHLAPAEGMATGALPLFLPWQGVEELYPKEWILDDEQAIADKILTVLEGGSWARDGDAVKRFIRDNYSVERVCRAWEALVVDDEAVVVADC